MSGHGDVDLVFIAIGVSEAAPHAEPATPSSAWGPGGGHDEGSRGGLVSPKIFRRPSHVTLNTVAAGLVPTLVQPSDAAPRV